MRMGLFHVEASLIGPTGVREDLSLLVDTGATFLVVSQLVADKLKLQPTRACPLRLAGARSDLSRQSAAGASAEVWPLAEVRLRFGEIEVTTPCLIAADGSALLGAVALESLLLAVDPVAKRLIPVDAFLGRLDMLTIN